VDDIVTRVFPSIPSVGENALLAHEPQVERVVERSFSRLNDLKIVCKK